jgi:hypothetical protein
MPIDPVEHALRQVFGPYAATPQKIAAFKAAMADAVSTNRRAVAEVEHKATS